MSSITATQPERPITNPELPISGPQASAQAAGEMAALAGPVIAAQAAAASSAAVSPLIGTVSVQAAAQVTPEQDSVAEVSQDPKYLSAEKMFRAVMLRKLNLVIEQLEGLGEAARARARIEAEAGEGEAEAGAGAGSEDIDKSILMRFCGQMVSSLSVLSKNATAIAKTLEDIHNLQNHYHLLKKLVGTNVSEHDLPQILREQAFLEEFNVPHSHITNTPRGNKNRTSTSKSKSKKVKSVVSSGGGGGGGGAAKPCAQELPPQSAPDFNDFVNQVFNGVQEADQKVTIHQRVRRWYKSGLTAEDVRSWNGYEVATREEIEQQMKMHTFPGLARVLTNRTIINQFVSRPDSDSPFIIAGFQATAEADFQFGKIQFGIDRKGCIYHMQFVELNNLELKEFVNGGQIKLSAARKGKKGPVQKKNDDGAVFTYVGTIETQESEDGENAILLTFPNNSNAPHLLKLFPLS